MITGVVRPCRGKGDAGTTLIEVMVGMTVMGVFLAMFTGAVVMMFNSANRTEALTTTSGQVDTAFARLDTSARYATAISQPGRSAAGNWYVEMQSINPGNGSTECRQLRVTPSTGPTPQQLQQRTWTVDGKGAAINQTSFSAIASNITNGVAPVGPGQPFSLLAVSSAVPYQRLQLQLTSALPNKQGGIETNSSITFTAMNSSPSTPVSGICAEVGRP